MSGQAEQAGGLATRYASALYDLADEQGALDTVAGDLKSLRKMIDDSDDFRRFIKSPVLTRAEQGAAIKALSEKAGLSALTQKFLGLAAANRRLFTLPGIITAFLTTLATRRGEVAAEVISAAPLSDAQVAAISAALKQADGRKISLSSKIDPSILGGLIVKVGSRMVDSSIKSKLQRLKLAMKGVG